MTRPNVDPATVVVPTFDTPMGDAAGQACGDSYKQTYVIRQPYKGVTIHETPLGNLLPPNFAWRDPATVSAIQGAISDVSQTMAGLNGAIKFRFKEHVYTPEDPTGQAGGSGLPTLGSGTPPDVITVVDATNREAIRNTYTRASEYLAGARALEKYWAEEYRPFEISGSTGTPPDHWPLFQDVDEAYPDCKGRAPGEVIDYQAEGTGFGSFTCPTEEALIQHEQDNQLYISLISAALHWARCGQEAVRVVAMHYLNKNEYEKTLPAGGGFSLEQLTPPPIIPSPEGPGKATPTPPEEPPNGGEPDLPGPDDGGSDPLPDPPVVADTSDTTVAKRGFAGLSTPAKVAVVGGSAFVIFQLMKRR